MSGPEFTGLAQNILSLLPFISLSKFVDSRAYQRNPIIRYSAFSGMKPAALPSGVNQSI